MTIEEAIEELKQPRKPPFISFVDGLAYVCCSLITNKQITFQSACAGGFELDGEPYQVSDVMWIAITKQMRKKGWVVRQQLKKEGVGRPQWEYSIRDDAAKKEMQEFVKLWRG